jgi:hypothetical protein
MNILLAFAPFIVFAVVDRFADATVGLVCGAVVSLALLLRDVISPTRKVKILEVGTMILFGGLAIYSIFGEVKWSIVGVRLCVDSGLLAIVLISIALGRPFTLQYAREHTAREIWTEPEFVRTNYIITAVWAAAFALMVTADLMMLYVPTIPLRVGIWTTILAILGAMKFTSWYPERKSGVVPPPR